MKNLMIKWTISKGKDTYGYNICTLWDNKKAYRCNGGGYDMLGTVFAEWLWDNYKDKIIATCDTAKRTGPCSFDGYYGFSESQVTPGHYYLEGACGFECMERIAKAIGLQIKKFYQKYRLVNIIVMEKEVALCTQD